MALRNPMNARLLRYPGSSTLVSCSDSRDLTWLLEFLRPSLWSRRSGASEWSVSLVRDGRERERLLRKRSGEGSQKKALFHLDTRTERFRVLEDAGSRWVVVDPLGETVCEVEPQRRRVRIVAEEDCWTSRLILMKFVRERAMRAAIEQGLLPLHAAGFVLEHSAVLIAGPKRSGKTSLLLHSLALATAKTGRGGTPQRLPIQYLSNDRTLLGRSGSSMQARGLPTIVSLRTPSLELFPEMRERLEASGAAPSLSQAEANRFLVGRAQPWRGTRYTLSPRQLCEMSGVDARASAPVGAILFPRVSGAPGGIGMVKLRPAEARPHLVQALFRAGETIQVGTLFGDPQKRLEVGRPDTERWIDALTHQVGCYACDLGSNAYDDDAWLRRLTSLLAKK